MPNSIHRSGRPAQRRALATLGVFALAFAVSAGAVFAAPRPQSADAGTIAGTIYFQGKRPVLHIINMGRDSVCESLHSEPVYPEDGQVNGNGTLPNAFIFVKKSSAKLTTVPPREPAVLTQKGCEYVPHVVGVMVGQPFEVINLDPTTHNIHVIAKLNRAWNVSQQPGSPSVVRRFTVPETMIPVRCNVHTWMKAYVGVVANPYYAVTGSKGDFTLKGLPPGNYTIEAWTADFGVQERQVEVTAGQTSTQNFTFENH